MNSDQIFAAIEKIAGETSKNLKVNLVAHYGANADWRRVLVAALDPSVTYGIAEVPEVVKHGRDYFTEGRTWDLITALAERHLTGNAALAAVTSQMGQLTPCSAELLKRIITKDLRAGFSSSTVNKAIPGLIPTFPYMRCTLPKASNLMYFPWEKGCYSQEKADGMFANLNHSKDRVISITSRQGSRFPLGALQDIADEAWSSTLPGTQTHGELLVEKDCVVLAREIGNGMLNSVMQGEPLAAGYQAVFRAWDQIPLAEAVEKGKGSVCYTVRWQSLKSQLAGCSVFLQPIGNRIVMSKAEAYEHYRELLKKGKEGTIVKSPNGLWKDGDSKDQVKLKLEADCDLVIKGFNAGKGKNADTFGSLVCATSDGLLEVSVSGMSDSIRKDLWTRRDKVVGMIATVRSNSVMSPSGNGVHSLFLPRLVEVRTDKQEADSLQRVVAQFEAAVSSV